MEDSKVIRITGRAVPVRGNDIDTDRIVPARYLKEIDFSRMGEYPFYDERFNADGTERVHPFNESRFQGASMLLANANFGCGSSREHAPQALLRRGIKAIVAESFAEIFAGNCAMLGIPAVAAGRVGIAALQAMADAQPGLEYTVDLAAMCVMAGELRVPVAMNASYRKALVDGTWDTTGLLLANAGRVEAVAKRLERMLA